jgi:hypothetical protein
MKRLAISIMLAILATLLWGQLPTSAQASPWAKPVPVSDIQKTPSSWFPDLAIGPDGSVHIIWSSGLPGKQQEQAGLDLLMYRELRNGKWSQMNDIDSTGKGGYTVRNSIIMGHDGRLHILVRAGLITTYSSAPWDSAWSVHSWSDPRRLNAGGSYFNALATDSKGTLHALYNEAIPDDPDAPKPACSFCADLFYRRSSDGGRTWSSPINLSQSIEGSVKQQVKIDANDNIHVVWEEGFDWYATQGLPTAGMYRRSRDGGKSWDPPVRFTLPSITRTLPATTPVLGATPVPTLAPLPDAPRQMTIGLYQNHVPLVVYRGDASNKLYYQTSEDNGGTWSKTATIPGVLAREVRDTDHDDYSMVTDGAGNVHLICAGYLSTDTGEAIPLKLLHLVWNGRAWSAPEVIASDDSYPTLDKVTSLDDTRLPIYPEWPRAAISGNSLHVTWFTRNKQDLFKSESSHYQVWYSVRRLDGPAVAPFALYTPAPTAAPPMPSPEPAPIPTPTLPLAVIDAQPIDQSQSWEGPGLVSLGMATFSAVALIGLVIGTRFLLVRRRRRARG